jgi:hypothetical protein
VVAAGDSKIVAAEDLFHPFKSAPLNGGCGKIFAN